MFQHALGTMFADLDKVLVYMDNILVVGTGSFDDHMQQLMEVLTRLEKNNLQVNPLKSFWAKDKVDYLGFVITRDGIMLQAKKIQGIRDLARPTNVKELQGLVRMIIFYKEMYLRQEHVMKALAERTGKGRKFE